MKFPKKTRVPKSLSGPVVRWFHSVLTLSEQHHKYTLKTQPSNPQSYAGTTSEA